MTELLNLFLNNLLPIILAASIGFALGKWLKLTPRSLSQVVFYVFSPCLVFKLLINNRLSNADILRTMAFAGLLLCLVGFLTWMIGRLLRLERSMLAAVLLSALFINAGNFGLPVTDFAFGEPALAYATLFFVAMYMLTNTVGVVIASTGSTDLPHALLGLLKLPATYALLLGIIFTQMNWQLPSPLERTVNLLGDAAIPSMLVLLGMQLVNVHWGGHLKPLLLTSGMRLLVAPFLAFLMTRPFGIQGPAFQAVVLESAMPTAVLATVLATEFDTQPSFVTSVVLVTTLISPLTITPLLYYLGA